MVQVSTYDIVTGGDLTLLSSSLPSWRNKMKIIQIQSWNKFIEEIEQLNGIRNEYESKIPSTVSKFLYRGQPDSKLRLNTTLERYVGDKIPLDKYFNFASLIKAKIESVTGKRWNIETYAEHKEWLNARIFPPFSRFPAHDYFAYLRHHGFPSPFLDWTRSPYIAAYFAMISTPKDGVKKVSIYAYLDRIGTKVWNVDGPVILSLGPYVTTHKRHYLQQSDYTICIVKDNSSWVYFNHELAKSMNQVNRQDMLWRIDIPISQRSEFLSKLESMNINSFSLFETEDKLMEHIYISEILLGKNL